MKHWRGLWINLLAAMVIAVPSLAAVITAASVPSTRSTGDTITATIWNNDVVGVYSYINNNIIPVLNLLTSRGDLYVYNGASLVRRAVGTDGQVLTADSAQADGVKWAAFANSTNLTTKGDLLTHNGAAATRLGVGANGTVLIADSAQTTGLKWGTPSNLIPAGTVVAWSPAFAGTSTIPTGWLLCDGTSSTPNLIGLFIVGTRPASSSATPATSGFGAQTVDARGAGVATHTHTIGGTFLTATTSSTTTCGSGAGVTVPLSSHVHTVPSSGSSAAGSSEPSDYALVYIMKQ